MDKRLIRLMNKKSNKTEYTKKIATYFVRGFEVSKETNDKYFSLGQKAQACIDQDIQANEHQYTLSVDIVNGV